MGTQIRTLLHLVFDKDASGQTLSSRGHFEPFQQSLLGSVGRTLFLCTTDTLTEQSFLSILTELNPKVTIDLRVSPRFDFGTLNRKRALALFEGLGISYFDAASNYHGGQDLTSNFNVDGIWAKILDEVVSTPSRNVTALADPSEDYRSIGISLGQQLRSYTGEDWEVVLQGPAETATTERQRVFISHANPDDNDFVLWLQAQLTRRGYEVWSDLTHLAAGEVFWNTIEDIIRISTAKVIVVVSRASMAKPGVLDEISLAVSVERSAGLERFVIPIRVDDLPFSDFRANIARKNVVDFASSWARGLTKLVDTLERDHVPVVSQSGGSQLAVWWQRQRMSRMKIERRDEELVSNQFEVRKLPERLFVLAGNSQQSPQGPLSAQLPVCPFQDGWLSLYSASELAKLGHDFRQSRVLTTLEFLSGDVSVSGRTTMADRERVVSRLLNRVWETYLTRRGFLFAPTTSGTQTMYVPRGLLEKDQSEFLDTSGHKRKRLLVGRSEKRKVNWHLGVIGRFKTGSPYVLQMKMRVIFTEDGHSALVQSERMAELRKAFCKNWWNDRWRSLQSALSAWLAQDHAVIALHTGDCGAIELAAMPQAFITPIGINEEDLSKCAEVEADDIDFGSLVEDLDEWTDTVDAHGDEEVAT